MVITHEFRQHEMVIDQILDSRVEHTPIIYWKTT